MSRSKNHDRKRPSDEKEIKDIFAVSDIEDFSVDEVQKIRVCLLEWYDRNQRVLPWRTDQQGQPKVKAKEKSEEEEEEVRAYAVWVSEMMLQQTRVATVIDYYNRWMQKWPTLYHLAQATQEEVNEMWAGLGYYRRARFLLEGAKSIVENGGKFPRTLDALRKVCGIGNYTAGAIASIAFKQAVPVVDGNVIRVVSRMKVISSNPKDPATVKSFWKLAGQLVDPIRPGDFNQALMELGAVLCTTLKPACDSCPVSDQCQALSISRNHDPDNNSPEKGSNAVSVTDYPRKVVKAKQRPEFAAICILQISECQPCLWKMSNHQDHFLLKKRPDEGLLAGLWEFPSVLLEKHEPNLRVRRAAMNQYLKDSLDLDFTKSCRVILREEVGEYVHVFSHIRLHMHIEWLVVSPKCGVEALLDEANRSVTWKYVDQKVIGSMGLTSGVKKVYNMMQDLKKNKLQSANDEKKKRKKL